MALKFGPASEFALSTAIQLAKQNDAALHIFHALDYTLQDLDFDDPKLAEIRTATKQRYKTNVKPLLGDLENVSFKCMPADPALEVCKMARDMDIDLIILGCHQQPEKRCFGRVDYVGMTILEKAPCPVMLVPLRV
jgi:nucleotide-binding universal stress UspA family protein